MSSPALRAGEDPLDALKALKATAAPDPLEQLLREKGVIKNPNAIHDEYAVGNLGRRMASENATDAAELADEPSDFQRQAGGVASFIHRVPFAEKTASIVRATLHGESYDQALSDIHQGQQSSGTVGKINAAVGGITAAAATPGSPALAGARYGVLDALGSPERMSSSDRLQQAMKEGLVGGVTAGATNYAATGARSILAPSTEDASIAMRSARKATDKTNYGMVDQEQAAAAQHPGPSAVSQALGHPGAQAATDAVRSSPKFANADEIAVARKVYQVLSKQERALSSKMDGPDYEPGIELSLDKVMDAKRAVAAALDEPLPSFRSANAEHGRMMGERSAFNDAATVGNKLVKGQSTGANALDTKSPAAYRADIPTLPANKAQAARHALLGRAHEQLGVSINPKTGFGVGRSLAVPARIGSTLQPLDAQANLGTIQHGLSYQDALRALGVSQAAKPEGSP